MKRNTQHGFSAVEGLLVLVIVGIVGFAGYKVFNAKNSLDQSNDSVSSQQSGSNVYKVPEAPTIDSASDLTKAEATLNQVNPDDNNADSIQLNDQLNGF